MAKFIECSDIGLKDMPNEAINLDNVCYIKKCEYSGLYPSIKFGFETRIVDWVYDSPIARDTDYERIIAEE